jgi:hypothetical protein
MNDEVKVDAQFTPAKHHNGDTNHDKQWTDDGICSLDVSDIPRILCGMKEALDKFNFNAMFDYIANKYGLNILNPDTGKMLVYKNAMSAVAKLSDILLDGTAYPAREFWLDNTWLQADIAFEFPIHCRIRTYEDEQLKVIMEFIPFSSTVSGERC